MALSGKWNVIEAISYEAGTSEYLHHVPTEACVCGHRPLEIDLEAGLQIAFPNNMSCTGRENDRCDSYRG